MAEVGSEVDLEVDSEVDRQEGSEEVEVAEVDLAVEMTLEEEVAEGLVDVEDSVEAVVGLEVEADLVVGTGEGLGVEVVIVDTVVNKVDSAKAGKGRSCQGTKFEQS